MVLRRRHLLFLFEDEGLRGVAQDLGLEDGGVWVMGMHHVGRVHLSRGVRGQHRHHLPLRQPHEVSVGADGRWAHRNAKWWHVLRVLLTWAAATHHEGRRRSSSSLLTFDRPGPLSLFIIHLFHLFAPLLLLVLLLFVVVLLLSSAATSSFEHIILWFLLVHWF